MPVELWAVGLVLVGTVIGSFGPIFMKKASSKFSLTLKGTILNWQLILGCFFYGVSVLIFIPALRGGDLSILYPLVSINYIWVSLLSMKLLKEKMNTYKWLGILLIIVGVAFIGIGA
jgi:uncharacterized membrane protein